VITTNSFADAGEDNPDLQALFDALYANTGRGGRFRPIPVSTMLDRMNGGKVIGSMFGLHGVDGDPQLTPFANLRKLGADCSTSHERGHEGNSCTQAGRKKVCSAACLADSACPQGFSCRQVASASTRVLDGRQCLK